MSRLSYRGSSAGANPEAAETLKWITEAWREQLVLYRFRDYSDPDLTPHAALFLEQELGSIVRYMR